MPPPARMFASAVPGLAGLLAAELEAIEGIRALETGFDGRSDIVTFTAGKRSVKYLSGLALAEDIFVEAGRTVCSEGDRASWIAGRLLKPERTTRAFQVLGQIRYAVRARASYRVIVRVRHERSFLRTDLRRHLAATIARQQPRWHFDDPSDLELWAVEYQPGKIIAGYRASDGRMRGHDGRAEERSGALRPTIAAAMVSLAGKAWAIASATRGTSTSTRRAWTPACPTCPSAGNTTSRATWTGGCAPSSANWRESPGPAGVTSCWHQPSRATWSPSNSG